VISGRVAVWNVWTPGPGTANAMVSGSGVRFASWIAARSEQFAAAVQHIPSAGSMSGTSFVDVTVNVAAPASAGVIAISAARRGNGDAMWIP
jgi:hypothetical protein